MLLTENQRSQMQNDGWNKRYHFEKSIQNLYDYFENIHSLYDLCASHTIYLFPRNLSDP